MDHLFLNVSLGTVWAAAYAAAFVRYRTFDQGCRVYHTSESIEDATKAAKKMADEAVEGLQEIRDRAWEKK